MPQELWDGSGQYVKQLGNSLGDTRISAYSAAITVTPTVSTSPAYTAADSIGGKISIANAVRLSGGGGRLVGIVVADKADQAAANLSFHFFNSDPSGSTITDNAALSIVDADALKYVGTVVVASTDTVDFTANRVYSKRDFVMPFHCSGGTTLYCALTTAGTPTFGATTDVQLIFEILQD